MIRAARPLFLLGTPRSGTTLLAHLLNAHRAVLMTNETAVMLQLGHMISHSRRGSQAGILFGKQYYELWADHLAEHARELVETYYARIAEQQSREELAWWGEKHPHNCDCLDLLESAWGEARYIYIVRDPRDSALSIAAMLNKPFQPCLENWKNFSDKYERFFAGLPAERYMLLRYEDLVADYEGKTRACLEWLGLGIDDGVAEYLESYKDVDAHGVAPLVRGKRPVPPGRKRDYKHKSVYRWQNELGKPDRRFAAERVGDFLEKYDYPHTRPSLWQRLTGRAEEDAS